MAFSVNTYLRTQKNRIQLRMLLRNSFGFTLDQVTAKNYHRNEKNMFMMGLANFWLYPKDNVKPIYLYNYLGKKALLNRVLCHGITNRNLKIYFKNSYDKGCSQPMYLICDPYQKILTLDGVWKPVYQLALGDYIKSNWGDMGYVWVHGMELYNSYEGMFSLDIEGHTVETSTGLYLN